MDVRCEKCNTEYELDEARLKPGGVTVKCTTCGHMFKIRKRTTTQSGPAVRSPTNAPPMAPPAAPKTGGTPVKGVPLPPMTARAQTGSGPVTAGEGERNWIIRLDNGETRACRELGILQQWIITGLVSRESMISRSGKTWKRLGDIAELASFFVVAEEAREQRVQRESGRITPPRGTAPRSPSAAPFERETVVEPLRVPGTGRNVAPPAPPVARAAATPAPPNGPAAGMRATVMGPAVPPPPPRPAAITPPPVPVTSPAAPPPPPPRPPGMSGAPTLLAPLPAPPVTPLPFAAPTVVAAPNAPTLDGPPPARPSTLPSALSAAPTLAPTAIPPPEQRSTGAWATEDVKPIADDGVGPRRGAVRATGGGNDSFGGVVRPVPTDDAAFVGGLAGGRGASRDAAAGSRRDEPLEDDAFFDEPRRRGPGLWIALGSLVVIAAAAGVVYFAVLRPGPSAGGNNATGDAGAIAAVDGGLLADAGTTAALVVDAASVSEDLLDQARVQLGRDASASLIAAEKLLADGGRNDAEGLALRARLVSAQVQILEDEAELARDAKTAEKVKREARQLVLTALGLAQRAIKAGAGNALANVAMADVLRLQGKPMKDLRRYLDTARAAAPADKEVGLVEALAHIRDKDYDKADALLRGLDKGALEGTGDVRPRWHLARIAFARKMNDEAREAANAVIAAQPEHAGARALIAKLGAVAVDPLPPDEDVDAGTVVRAPIDAGPDPGPGTGVATPTGNDYDKLLAKANKLAEVDCGQAMAYYGRALEVRPNGVDALTGMGFCHIDAKQFASAHSKFRAALGISPRNERALWGVAEAYQQQGRTDLAITAYEKYLEVYPGSAAAQRQLDRLKGKATGPTPPEGGSGGTGAGTAAGGGTGTAAGGGTGDPPPEKPPEKPPEPPTEPGPSTDPSSTP